MLDLAQKAELARCNPVTVWIHSLRRSVLWHLAADSQISWTWLKKPSLPVYSTRSQRLAMTSLQTNHAVNMDLAQRGSSLRFDERKGGHCIIC
ncbi:hypothetical protein Plhal304r1_c059g0147921 [Plasmopara halstedii]